MSLGPDRAPVVYPVFGWFEIADGLDGVSEGALAAAIRTSMEGRRLGDDAAFARTEHERVMVVAVLEDGAG